MWDFLLFSCPTSLGEGWKLSPRGLGNKHVEAFMSAVQWGKWGGQEGWVGMGETILHAQSIVSQNYAGK